MTFRLYFGVTERGDAGLDLSWSSNLQKANLLITKNITNEFIDKVLECHGKGYNIIVHATITGYGGTIIEPNVPSVTKAISQLCRLINLGFPSSRIVLRVDPIIPTPKGIERAFYVIAKVKDSLNAPFRVRFSFIDLYPHVRARLVNAGMYLPNDWTSFHTPLNYQDGFLRHLPLLEKEYGLEFESCAENTNYRVGCISKKDYEVLGLKFPGIQIGGQQRQGCLCLGNKKELLKNKSRCQHKCLYCFWKDDQEA